MIFFFLYSNPLSWTPGSVPRGSENIGKYKVWNKEIFLKIRVAPTDEKIKRRWRWFSHVHRRVTSALVKKNKFIQVKREKRKRKKLLDITKENMHDNWRSNKEYDYRYSRMEKNNTYNRF